MYRSILFTAEYQQKGDPSVAGLVYSIATLQLSLLKLIA